MTGSSAGAAAHLDDAALVRLLDGEDTAGERSAWDAHIAACDRCADAAGRLRADAATVRGWLERAAFEDMLPDAAARHTPPMRRVSRAWHATGPWLRAAMITVLVAAPAAAIPAVRHAVAGAIADLRTTDLRTTSEPAGPAAASVPDAAPATIRFQPAAGEFVVRLDAAQAMGTLRIVPTAGHEAVLHMDDGGAVGPIIAAGAVHLRNDPSSTGSYVLYVTPAVSSVKVLIAGRTAVVVPATSLTAAVELPLR
jgi:hypothetical protein